MRNGGLSWTELDEISKIYRSEGAFAAMGRFGAMVDREGGPSEYSEEMQQVEPTPESAEMMDRMAGDFDLFMAHELWTNGSYVPEVNALKSTGRPGSSVPQAGRYPQCGPRASGVVDQDARGSSASTSH